jgi:hypothetical protein
MTQTIERVVKLVGYLSFPSTKQENFFLFFYLLLKMKEITLWIMI